MRALVLRCQLVLAMGLCVLAAGCSSGTSSGSSSSPTGSTGTPTASLTPGTLTFTLQSTGSTSPAQNVKLENSGTAALSISNIKLTGDFAIASKTCGSTLTAGASCTISVAFSPKGAGSRSGSLSVSDNAASGTQTTALDGTGAIATMQEAGCTEVASSSFPTCFALSSPTAIASNSGSQFFVRRAKSADSRRVTAQDSTSGSLQTQFSTDTAQIAALLAGTDPDPAGTLETLGGNAMSPAQYANASCFGPSIYYANNPDAISAGMFPATSPGGGFAISGYYPGGGLGIWTPTDSGQACAVSQFNLDMMNVSQYTQFGLAVAAEAQVLAGSNFPTTAGASTDVSAAMSSLLGSIASGMQLTITYDGTSYIYHISFSATVQQTAVTTNMVLTQTPGANPYAYSGLLYFSFNEYGPSDTLFGSGTITADSGSLQSQIGTASGFTLPNLY